MLLLLACLSSRAAEVLRTEVYCLGDPAVAATLLVPDTTAPEGGFPAVVLLHDHGAHFSIGREKMVSPAPSGSTADSQTQGIEAVSQTQGIEADSKAWVDTYYDGAYVGDSLAAAGYVVIAMDALYWGSRAISQPDWQQVCAEMADTSVCRSILRSPTLRSYNKALRDYQPTFYESMAPRQVWFDRILRDDRATVSYLIDQCHLSVNPSRIACFGFSMGAYRAWQLASADPRIAVCVAANWMTTFAANGGPLPNASAWSMYRPSAYPKDDYPVVASRIAPRPFLLMYGEQDPLFPKAAVLEADSVIRAAYHAAAADSLYRLEAYPVRHFFSHDELRALLSFLNEHL